MGVLKELKELIKEMGGDASQAQTIGQAVDKIPASGGGSDTIILHMSTDEDHYGYLDMTAGEIKEAFEAQKTLVLFVHEDAPDGNSTRPTFCRCVGTSFCEDTSTSKKCLTMDTFGDSGRLPYCFYANSYDEYPLID